MPVQTQMSSFAKKMGARVAQANEEHRDKPIDTGDRRLPSGIKEGIAKITAAYTNEYPDDKNGPGTKGQTYFYIAAVALVPESHNGEKVAGILTKIIIPLCDWPAKGNRKAKSFSENWYEFQNVFKLLGINPPNETAQTDPTGQRTEAYYFAAMKTLVDPARKPTYIKFSTRGWMPPATSANPKPTEMVFEDWHGLSEAPPKHDPAAGVSTQPSAMSAPPSGPTVLNPTPTQGPEETPFNEFASGMPDQDQADTVSALVEIAMNDPEGATEEGGNASAQLEEMAWANGWAKEQTASASDWGAVGDMVLNPPATSAPTHDTQPPASTPAANQGPTIGSKHKFAKRTKDGAKLTDTKGVQFPPQDVEVTSIDAAAQTCTVKTTKDGKDVVDIRTKKPVAVKFEWLE